MKSLRFITIAVALGSALAGSAIFTMRSDAAGTVVAGSVEYQYDSLGRLYKDVSDTIGVTSGVYEYDDAGNFTEQTVQ